MAFNKGGAGIADLLKGTVRLTLYKGAQLIWPTVSGEELFSSAGEEQWVCPAGVTSVNVCCIAGGGNSPDSSANGGGGGALAWKNNIPVTPGQSYTVQSAPADIGSTSGRDSYFSDRAIVSAKRGSAERSGGSFTGDGGGNGGYGGALQGASGYFWGGGGAAAAGYSSTGAAGQNAGDYTAPAGSTGGGSPGCGATTNISASTNGGNGGGTMPFGQGDSGIAHTGASSAGHQGSEPGGAQPETKTYGGGSYGFINGIQYGGGGAVVLRWGIGTEYPAQLE